MGSESRMTLGSYVFNRACEKVVAMFDNVYMCRCGSAADCQTIADYVKSFIEQLAITTDDKPKVKEVAKVVQQLMYKNQSLSGGFIIGGWDSAKGGQVFNIASNGALIEDNWQVDGSGSTYVWGACDSIYKTDMTKEEAIDMAITVISCAGARDSGSGGIIRLYIVDSAGCERRLIEPKHQPVYPGSLPSPTEDIVMQD